MGHCIVMSRFINSDSDGGSIALGDVYTFGNYKWMCVELYENYAVLQGYEMLTSGEWPGLVLPQFGNGSNYSQSIVGADISDYSAVTQSLYNAISRAEYTEATEGNGLYLISYEKVAVPNSYSSGAWQLNSSYYSSALLHAAQTDIPSGVHEDALLGDLFGSAYPWDVSHHYGDVVGNTYQHFISVLAPAFNVDLSKIKVSTNNVIRVK